MAGTVTKVEETVGSVKKIVYTFTASTGAAPGIATSQTTAAFVGQILECITDPGATAPTANWDCEVLDEDSMDVLCGSGANQHSTNTTYLTINQASLGTVVNDKLRLNVTNAGSGATGVVYVYIR